MSTDSWAALPGGAAAATDDNVRSRVVRRHRREPTTMGRAIYFSTVTTSYTMLAELPKQVEPDTSSVRFAICGAPPASVELLKKFHARYGIPVIEGYGLSEGSWVTTPNPLDGVRKPGTFRCRRRGKQCGSTT